MKIYFKEKPHAEETSKYEDKLNYYLQYLNAKVKIKLMDEPIRIESFINGVHDDTTYQWVDCVEIQTPEITIEADLFSQYIGHDGAIFDEKYAWTDAAEIQDEIYKKMRKFKPGFGKDNNDLYWRLWDLMEQN